MREITVKINLGQAHFLFSAQILSCLLSCYIIKYNVAGSLLCTPSTQNIRRVSPRLGTNSYINNHQETSHILRGVPLTRTPLLYYQKSAIIWTKSLTFR